MLISLAYIQMRKAGLAASREAVTAEHASPQGGEEPYRLQSKSDRRPSSAFASESGGQQRPSISGRHHREADSCPPFPLVPLMKACCPPKEYITISLHS